MSLNPRQRAFVDAYAGNASEAARKAGYSPASANVTGSKLLANPNIRAAIDARESQRSGKAIATREQRQAFWTAVMQDAAEEMAQRLKASELLGKSEADFTEKHEHSLTDELAGLLKEARARAQRR